MSVTLVHNNYGKNRVRLMKVARRGETHEIQETSLQITFEGDFTEVHTLGDNSHVLPTDTMKNTVYALAHQTPEIEEIETFGARLANHFLANNPQIARARIDMAELGWARLLREGGDPHPHAFIKNGSETRTCRIDAARDRLIIESGIENLVVLKTTKSGFTGFIKDQYTTLPEATDRILATSVKADWRYRDAGRANFEIWQNVRQTIIETFSHHDSLSVQHTLFAMGEAVLEKFPDIAEISFSLPNIHYLPVDTMRFGLENDNRIFLPTDEPHGLIEARLSR